jgi:hypothetical protein
VAPFRQLHFRHHYKEKRHGIVSTLITDLDTIWVYKAYLGPTLRPFCTVLGVERTQKDVVKWAILLCAYILLLAACRLQAGTALRRSEKPLPIEMDAKCRSFCAE